MDLTIETTAHGIVTLQPVMPSGWLTGMRIPGSDVWSAEGDFGTIFFEEVRSGPFMIRFSFFRFLKKTTLVCRSHVSSVVARVATKNNWRYEVKGAGHMRLREGQFALYHAGGAKEKIVFEKGREFRSVDAICCPGKLKEFIPLFPELSALLDTIQSGHSSFFAKKPEWVSPEAIDIIRNIPDCPFEGSMRNYYIEHRLEELFFLLLVLALKKEPGEAEPLEEEVKAVHTAGRMILADITQHYSIPAIARRVHLNEFRLKYVFKYVFKKGIFEYLLEARMQEARRLLMHSDKPIKEIASLTGYLRLTSFITAFRKHFGYTPGSVRRTT